MQQPSQQQQNNFDIKQSSSSSSCSTVTIVQSCTGCRNGDDARESRSKRTFLEFDSTPQHPCRIFSDECLVLSHRKPSFCNGGSAEKRHKLEPHLRLGLETSDCLVNMIEQKQTEVCYGNASDQILHLEFSNAKNYCESNQHVRAKSLNHVSANADSGRKSEISESSDTRLPRKSEFMENNDIVSVDNDKQIEVKESVQVITDASITEADAIITDNNANDYVHKTSHRAMDLKITVPEPTQEQDEECNESVDIPVKQCSKRALIDVTNKFQVDSAPGMKEPIEETDIHRLQQRQKQIEYGKNTLGYERYLELVPKSKRSKNDPQTPNPKQVCSKRSWDGQIRKWRRLLHNYDPPVEDGEEIAEDFTVLKSSQKYEESKGDEVLNNINQTTVKKDYESSIHEDWTEL